MCLRLLQYCTYPKSKRNFNLSINVPGRLQWAPQMILPSRKEGSESQHLAYLQFAVKKQKQIAANINSVHFHLHTTSIYIQLHIYKSIKSASSMISDVQYIHLPGRVNLTHFEFLCLHPHPSFETNPGVLECRGPVFAERLAPGELWLSFWTHSWFNTNKIKCNTFKI